MRSLSLFLAPLLWDLSIPQPGSGGPITEMLPVSMLCHPQDYSRHSCWYANFFFFFVLDVQHLAPGSVPLSPAEARMEDMLPFSHIWRQSIGISAELVMRGSDRPCG